MRTWSIDKIDWIAFGSVKDYPSSTGCAIFIDVMDAETVLKYGYDESQPYLWYCEFGNLDGFSE